MNDLYDYLPVRNTIHEESQSTRELWTKTALKRRIASMFARMRMAKDVSQKDIADRTGWDKGFLSRLESTQGGLPDINTIARFAEACDLAIGLVVCAKLNRDMEEYQVVDAMSLYTESSFAEMGEGRTPPNRFIHIIGNHLSLKVDT